MFFRVDEHCHTPLQMEKAASLVGWSDLHCFQTGNSGFYARVQAVINHRFGVLTLTSTGEAIYTGGRPQKYNNFCMTNNFGTGLWDHGVEVRPGTLFGMNPKDDANFFFPVGSMLSFMACVEDIEKSVGVLEKLFPGKGAVAHNYLSRFNELLIRPVDHRRFYNAVQQRLLNPVEDASGTDFQTLIAMLAQIALDADKQLVRRCPGRIDFIRELVEDQMVNNSFAGMNLEMVANSLATSPRTLHQATSDAAGMGPMDLLRYCRLEQVRRVMTDKPSRECWQEQTGLKATAGNVFKHFGMTHQSRAGAAYKEVFGVTPKQDQLDHSN